jgi:hypothetical protein
MDRFRDILGVIDRPHFPSPAAAERAHFKEWFHFNVLDAGSGAEAIVNLSFSGDVTVAGGGRADVILLVHRPGAGWCGGIRSFEATAAELERERLQLRVGDDVALAYDEGVFRLAVAQPDQGIRLQATLTPRAEPMLLWNDTPLGSGRLNWLIAPHLTVDGELTVGGARIALRQACGYHDHNWGCWRWGDDFGWEWGFAADMAREPDEGRTTLVFDRTTDRLGAASYEHTLAVWRGSQLAKVFTRRMLRAQRHGRFGGAVPRRPGAARLVADGAVLTVPRRFAVSARDGADWLDLEYAVDAALQVAVPSDYGFGLVGLNETFGGLQARGVLGGEAVAFGARACFEFLG